MAIALAALMMMKNFLPWQNPFAILSLLTIQRASQVDPNAIPSRASEIDPIQSRTHLRTCWWDNSRLNIGPLAMAVKPSTAPEA